MWGCLGIGKLQVFIAPLLDKCACHCAHNAQEEADKQHDIDANGGTLGYSHDRLAIGGGERLVYFDDECCDNGREESVLHDSCKKLQRELKVSEVGRLSPG